MVQIMFETFNSSGFYIFDTGFYHYILKVFFVV